MSKTQPALDFLIRNVAVEDINEVYKILVENRPYVGLNSRYTYFLLARDFSDTCVVAEQNNKVVAFSSGYIPPNRCDTFFNWEIVVHKGYQGHGLQKRLLLHQIRATNALYFEASVNPSNEVAETNFRELAKLLKTNCETKILFSEEDFENDGHEAEIILRIGPISRTEIMNLFDFNRQLRT
jgi:L-2,4-diaminobutyric acid acetyltransferase